MNKPILTCTDGSVYARSVYHYSAWAAKQLSLPVNVVHMLNAHRERAELNDFSGNLTPGNSEELLEELVTLEESRNRIERLRGEAILESAGSHLKDMGVVDFQVHQFHGSLVEHLEEETEKSSLCIIGKRGEAHGKAREHLGSNMERSIRASKCPILVTSQQVCPLEKFLFAYDGGMSSEKALDYLVTEPLLRSLTCHLVRVGHATPEAEEDVEKASEKLKEAGYSVETRIVSGEPAHVFSFLVEKEEVNLLVMGAYGHSKFRQFLVGSTTTEMIRSCRVPVLMFR